MNIKQFFANQDIPIPYDVNGTFDPADPKWLVPEPNPIVESYKFAFVGSKMYSLLTNPEAFKKLFIQQQNRRRGEVMKWIENTKEGYYEEYTLTRGSWELTVWWRRMMNPPDYCLTIVLGKKIVHGALFSTILEAQTYGEDYVNKVCNDWLEAKKGAK